MPKHHHTMNVALLMLIVAIFVGGVVFFWQTKIQRSLENSVDKLSTELMKTQEERADSQSHIQTFEVGKKTAEQEQKQLQAELEAAEMKLLHTQFNLAMHEKHIKPPFFYYKDLGIFVFLDTLEQEGEWYDVLFQYDPQEDENFKEKKEVDVFRVATMLHRELVTEEREMRLLGQEDAKVVYAFIDTESSVTDDCMPLWTRDELWSIDLNQEEITAELYIAPREEVQKETQRLAACAVDEE
ncbi:hypothetical protein KKG22_04415 [Patescibacteria group bacterium]|nr:hypothetical protein [Patescibacteria group bacterium]MBU1721400.1 hypothetical protein [Patescibacteria group bacterium]MBU1901840.1 hypothetical protein [Patescibacteria group bacterium]